jgi:tRNA (cmo5U34)-methyltransferase
MSQFHFDPATYMELMRSEVPLYETLQATIAAATAPMDAAVILDLGTGTGGTLAGVLDRHPAARAIGVDENDAMLEVARARLAEHDVQFVVADLLDPLPEGPFDLVTSALAVHHLDGPGKAELFGRVADVLRPGGRFVLGDVVLTEQAVTPLTDDYDKPSTLADQVKWLEAAGFVTEVIWQGDDLAVVTADQVRSGTTNPVS